MERATLTRPTLPGGVDPLQLVPSREFDRLALLLSHSEQGAWVFCLYNTAPVRDAIVEALRARLDPLPVYEFTLSPQQPNPRDYLRHLPADAASRRAVIFFYDAWRAFDSGFFGYLDLQREQFMKAPHSLVFWIHDADRAAIARHAPNFFSRHAGVFDFRVTIPEQVEAIRGFWVAQPIGWDSVEERDRQERLYVGLLAEYEADEEPDQAAIAELLGKLANIWYFSDRLEEAGGALQRRLELTRTLEDRSGEANTHLALGQLAIRRYDLDGALERYEEALRLYRAVGDRLGEANTLKAIGDVLNFRKELDGALERYEEALRLYRAVGDRLGEANTLGSMSRLALQKGDNDQARALLQQAVSLHTAIGSRYDVAVDLGNFGLVLRNMGRMEEARPYLLQAAEVFEAIGLTERAEKHRQAAG